jgi:hypothetical protein
MRNLLWLSLCGGLLLIMPLSAATIQYQVAPTLTAGVYEFTYFINGTFSANQEIDIQFDPSLYTALSNGQASPSSDWDLMLLQPNMPLGGTGDYQAYAMVNNPSLAGPFKVDGTYTGSGTPGSQAFTIKTLDSSGMNVISETAPSWTTPYNTDPVPEPSSVFLSAVGLSVLGVFKAVRRRSGRVA